MVNMVVWLSCVGGRAIRGCGSCAGSGGSGDRGCSGGVVVTNFVYFHCS